MRLLSLEVQNYRNICAARLEPGRELTVTAQEEHVPLNFPPLSQTGNRLVYHRLINAGSNIFPFCSLIQQRLNVRLCKNAAACSSR